MFLKNEKIKTQATPFTCEELSLRELRKINQEYIFKLNQLILKKLAEKKCNCRECKTG